MAADDLAVGGRLRIGPDACHVHVASPLRVGRPREWVEGAADDSRQGRQLAVTPVGLAPEPEQREGALVAVERGEELLDGEQEHVLTDAEQAARP